jgi:GrpB-like predicted nucleotidyltransferase (UPF0157 family)
MKFSEYQRQHVGVRDWDASALRVFGFVRSQIGAVLPDVGVEHIGSTSVPGLRGKGFVDAMVLPDRTQDVAAIVKVLEHLGFQPARGSRPERPFFLAGVTEGPMETNVHVYVIVADSDEARTQRGFAAALRGDPALRDQYAAVKVRAVESGSTDPMRYSIDKGDWVVETLDRLGLPPLPDPGPPPKHARD